MSDNKLAINGGSPVRSTLLPFGRPDIRKEEVESVNSVLRSRWIGTGPKVPEFTEKVRGYIGAEFAISTNSASAALHLALLVSGIKTGDEVITSTITFPSTVNMIENCGAKPVFVDVDPDTGLMNPDLIEKVINKKTKAIMPVHLYGQLCDLDKIRRIAKRVNLMIIEDAAEAFGAKYKGEMVGSKSDFAAFSFAVNKVITTAEGGVLVTRHLDLEDKLKMLVLHGMNKNAMDKYPYKGFKEHFIEIPGYKYNMTDMHATIGLAQLSRVDEIISRRQEIANMYDEAFKDLPLKTLTKVPSGSQHGMCFYAVLLDLEQLSVDRSKIQEALLAENIGTAVHFFPMHLQPFYAIKYNFKKGDFPKSENFYLRTLSLPVATDLTNEDINHVIDAVKKVLTYYKDFSHTSGKTV